MDESSTVRENLLTFCVAVETKENTINKSARTNVRLGWGHKALILKIQLLFSKTRWKR